MLTFQAWDKMDSDDDGVLSPNELDESLEWTRFCLSNFGPEESPVFADRTVLFLLILYFFVLMEHFSLSAVQ